MLTEHRSSLGVTFFVRSYARVIRSRASSVLIIRTAWNSRDVLRKLFGAKRTRAVYERKCVSIDLNFIEVSSHRFQIIISLYYASTGAINLYFL